MLRSDGAELPWLLDGPGAATDPSQRHRLLGAAVPARAGRFLQLRLTLVGRRAVRRRGSWRCARGSPRFSYSRDYLPAVYREDENSADFLERFLANFEGMFTSARGPHRRRLRALRRAQRAGRHARLAGRLARAGARPAVDEARKRQLIRFAMPLFQYRGHDPGRAAGGRSWRCRAACRPRGFALPTPSQRQPLRRPHRRALPDAPPAACAARRDRGRRHAIACRARSPQDALVASRGRAKGLQRRYRACAGRGRRTRRSRSHAASRRCRRRSRGRRCGAASAHGRTRLACRSSPPPLRTAWTELRQSDNGGRASDRRCRRTGRDAAQREAWREFIGLRARRPACAAGSRAGRGSLRGATCASRRYQRATGADWPQFELDAGARRAARQRRACSPTGRCSRRGWSRWRRPRIASACCCPTQRPARRRGGAGAGCSSLRTRVVRAGEAGAHHLRRAPVLGDVPRRTGAARTRQSARRWAAARPSSRRRLVVGPGTSARAGSRRGRRAGRPPVAGMLSP